MSGELLFTSRDQEVVQEVTRFGVMTREQLMALRFFTSKTRANERLRRLVQKGFLVARAQPLAAGGPRLVYLPGPLALSGYARTRRHSPSDLFLPHLLGIVDVRLAFERGTTVTRWLSDKELGVIPPGVCPDAYLEYDVAGLNYSAFLEYDRGTETLGRIEQKVRKYVELASSTAFERRFHRRFFRALFVADSDVRLEALSRAAARVTDRVCRFTTRPNLQGQGVLASIWRRPGGKRTESLTGA